MDDSTLLDRLRDDDEIADLLDTVADVSIDRLDPVEDLYFASGTAFEVIAGGRGRRLLPPRRRSGPSSAVRGLRVVGGISGVAW
ncbi:hypothetical protein ACFOJ6_10115 [Gordonia humi]|uniref:hypothetical protein n=1 Tax=Gordonia humi TaxID=686429 RepID=UPI00361F638D